MIYRYKSLLGLGMAVGLTMVGGTALAASPTPKFTVTGLSIQSVTTSGSNKDVNIAITVLDTGALSGTWEFPSSNLVPEITITDTQTNSTSPAIPGTLISNHDPTVMANDSATAIYAFQLPPTVTSLGNMYSIQLVNQPSIHNHNSKTSNVFHMFNQAGQTAPVYNEEPPLSILGQLPEVPWAAALPLVALGTVGAIWVTRRNTHRRSAAS